MKVSELGRTQLIELKERYYMSKNENVSYGELADIDNIITDKEIFEQYEGIEFVEDDFFSKFEEKIDKEKCLRTVINVLMDMLQVNGENIHLGYMREEFEGWCEEGTTFENLVDNSIEEKERLNNTEASYCGKIMIRIAPLVDNLTCELANIFEEIKEENEKNK